MKKLRICAMALLALFGAATAHAQRGYHNAPYTRYEADQGTLAGGAQTKQSYSQSEVTFEASDRTSVLANNGGSVTWTNVQSKSESGSFNRVGITLRFAIADGANERDGDITRNIDVSVNNQYKQTVTLHSKWSWEHIWDNGNGNNNGISNTNYRFRFDEVRIRIDESYSGPISIKLEAKGDGVYFDFIEVEDVPAPIPCPNGFTRYTSGDMQTFVDGNAKCYIPEGTYDVGRTLELNGNDKELQGAGAWYTTINFTRTEENKGGLWSNFDAKARDFSLTTVQSSRSNSYKGINGVWGPNSVIENVFVDHFECGAWIANYNIGFGNDSANGLQIRHCRFRNNYADGINFCKGSQKCLAEFCSFRNNGDDDMAVWPANDMQCNNNTFRFNTAELCWRASSCALYGGSGNKWQNIVIKDNYEVGIRIASTFVGACFGDGDMNEMTDIDVIGCGTWQSVYNSVDGAVEITQSGYACGGVVKNVKLSCIDIIDSNSDALQFRNEKNGTRISDVQIDGITIKGTSKRNSGMNNNWGTAGGIRFVDGPTMQNCIRGSYNKNNTGSITIVDVEGEAIVEYGSRWSNMTEQPFAQCKKAAVEGVELPATETIGIDETKKLTATVKPADAANKKVSWKSDNENIVRVDQNGNITGVAPGTATITVTTEEGNKTATCKVTVKRIDVSGVKFTTGNVTVAIGATAQVTATVEPANATEKGITYAVTAGQNFASVDANTGVVTGIAEGTATITATTKEGNHTATCTVTVVNCKPSDFDVDLEVIEVKTIPENPVVGDQVKFVATIRNNSKNTVTQGFGVVFGVDEENPTHAQGKTTFLWNNQYKINDNKEQSAGQLNLTSCSTLEFTTNGGAAGSDSWPATAGKHFVTIVIDDNGWVSTIKDEKPNYKHEFTVTEKKEATNVTIDNKNAYTTMTVGDKGQLNATVAPADATDKTVTWSSNNPNIISVDANGNIEAKAEGTATITVTTANGKEDSVTITVNKKAVPVGSLAITNKDAVSAMTINDNRQIQIQFSNPDNPDNKNVTWKSSNQNAVTVDDAGNVKAVGGGTAIITVTSAENASATDNVTITVTVPVTDVEIQNVPATMTVGDKATLTAVVTPANATDKNVTWSSSNPNIISVDANGNITAVAAGEATITATVDGKDYTTATIKVNKAPVNVQALTISAGQTTVTEGEKVTFTAAIAPNDADAKEGDVVYEITEGNTLGTINGNVLTTSGAGTIKVQATVKNADNSVVTSNEVTINVKPAFVPVAKVTISGVPTEMTENETAEITVKIEPADATNKNVTWTKSDNIEITDNGNGTFTIKATAAGNATIKATVDGKESDEVTINVKPAFVPVAKVEIQDKTTLAGTDAIAGGEITVKATVSPNNATNKTITWEVTGADSKDNGDGTVTVTFTDDGTVSITAKAGDKTDNVTVTVRNPEVIGITISGATSAVVGNDIQLTATVDAENNADETVTWSSNNTDITVDENGKVSSSAAGTATITATAGGKTTTYDVTFLDAAKLATDFTVTASKTDAQEGDKVTFTLVFDPIDATNQGDVVFSITDGENLGTLDANNVLAITADADGTITVNVTLGTISHNVKINVTKKPAVNEITLSETVLTLGRGDSQTLTATVNAVGGASTDVIWKSADEAIATVDETTGVVTAVAKGTTEIYAVSKFDTTVKSNECTVTVNVPLKDFTIAADNTTVTAGENVTFSATLNPTDADDQNVVYTIESGNEYGTLAGNILTTSGDIENDQTIVVSAKVGNVVSTNTVTITVTAKPKPSVTIDVTPATLELVEGNTGKVSATVNVLNGATNGITWKSENEAIATVDADGNVTAVAEGNTTIYAVSTFDNTESTNRCAVTVTPKPAVTKIEIQDNLTLILGGAGATLTADVTVVADASKDVTWKSNNPKIATVDANGNVTAVAKGNTTIYAVSKFDTTVKSNDCAVTVNLPAATGITLSETTLTLEKGKNATLTATVTPNEADQTMVWTSDDESIATVVNGKVVAKGKGTATITVTTADGTQSATCTVTVTVTAKSIAIDAPKSLEVEQTATLTATVRPDDAEQEVTWSTSDASVISVDATTGAIEALKVGKADITATATDGSGVSKTVTINVKEKTYPVTEITVNAPETDFMVGDKATFTATVKPDNATNAKVTWSSSNPNVATVDKNGNVTAKGAGWATITASATDGSGVSGSVNVNVEAKPVVYKVELSETRLDLPKGESFTLYASVIAESGVDQSVTWTSSDPSIASVDADGNVTAHKAGSVLIKATSNANNERFSSCKVNVIVPVTGVTINASATEVSVGETVILSASLNPADATNADVKYSVESGRGTISGNTLTVKGAGEIVVRVTTADGGYTDEIVITAGGATGIDDVEANAGKSIETFGNTVVVSGLEVGETVSVFTIPGVQELNIKAANAVERFTLPTGVHIVRIDKGNITKKVMIVR